MTSLPKEETLILQNDHFRSLVADLQYLLFYAPTSGFVQQNLILLNKICFVQQTTLSKQKQGATIVAHRILLSSDFVEQITNFVGLFNKNLGEQK